jgi:hypothetical protein
MAPPSAAHFSALTSAISALNTTMAARSGPPAGSGGGNSITKSITSLTTKITSFEKLLGKFTSTLSETQKQFGVSIDAAANLQVAAFESSVESFGQSLKSLDFTGFGDALNTVMGSVGEGIKTAFTGGTVDSVVKGITDATSNAMNKLSEPRPGESAKLPVTQKEELAAMKAYQDGFGVLNKEAAKSMAQTAKDEGISIQALIQSRRTFATLAMGDLSKVEKLQNNFENIFKQKGLSPRIAMESIAKYSELLARNGNRFADSFARAAADAKKIGVDLSKVDQIGDSIISDFEGFLEKSAELGAMGFNLDTNTLAQLAESGDTGALFNELRSQLASTGKDITKLRRSEQLALSGAFGISMSDIQRLAGKTPEETADPMDIQQNSLLSSILVAMKLVTPFLMAIGATLGLIAMAVGAPGFAAGLTIAAAMAGLYNVVKPWFEAQSEVKEAEKKRKAAENLIEQSKTIKTPDQKKISLDTAQSELNASQKLLDEARPAMAKHMWSTIFGILSAGATFLATRNIKASTAAFFAGSLAGNKFGDTIDTKLRSLQQYLPAPTGMATPNEKTQAAINMEKRAAAQAARSPGDSTFRDFYGNELIARDAFGNPIENTLSRQAREKARADQVSREAVERGRALQLRSVTPVKKASGGLVTGPGTGKSDSIPARLSNGEFVINADMVKKLGLPFLNKLNTNAIKGTAIERLLSKAPMLSTGISKAQEVKTGGVEGLFAMAQNKFGNMFGGNAGKAVAKAQELNAGGKEGLFAMAQNKFGNMFGGNAGKAVAKAQGLNAGGKEGLFAMAQNKFGNMFGGNAGKAMTKAQELNAGGKEGLFAMAQNKFGGMFGGNAGKAISGISNLFTGGGSTSSNLMGMASKIPGVGGLLGKATGLLSGGGLKGMAGSLLGKVGLGSLGGSLLGGPMGLAGSLAAPLLKKIPFIGGAAASIAGGPGKLIGGALGKIGGLFGKKKAPVVSAMGAMMPDMGNMMSMLPFLSGAQSTAAQGTSQPQAPISVDTTGIEKQLNNFINALQNIQVNMDGTKVGKLLVASNDAAASIGVFREQFR